ncbi:tyrosine-type recombinase/integrase [Burkholderia sp. MR1-5-21]
MTCLLCATGLGGGYGSHSGRRTFASRLLARGHSIEAVQLLVGHVDVDHVSPYLDVSEREQREAVAAIDLGE